MRIIVGFEYTQVVTEHLLNLGHEVFSCDLREGEKGLPHIRGNIRDHLGPCRANNFKGWQGGIFFPPCTDLANSGARWFPEKIANGSQSKSIRLFKSITKTSIFFTAVENPIGIMSTKYRKPDQIIQPFQFGDPFRKSTCIWVKHLPLLTHTRLVDQGMIQISKSGKKIPVWYSNNKKLRDRTFPGIAEAMAKQWFPFPLLSDHLKHIKIKL